MAENRKVITNFVRNNLSNIPTLAHQNIILKEWLVKVVDCVAKEGGDQTLFSLLRIISQEDVFRCQKCNLVFGESRQIECWKCRVLICAECENASGGKVEFCKHWLQDE